MSSSFFVRSYAKVNVTLDVLGKRPDGYHELATIMQTIDLYDTICLLTTEKDMVSMVCNRPELSNDDNLVVRAAQALRQKLGLTRGLHIELNKRIPVAAGLGGGSGNAAATLLALRKWWNLPLSDEDLWEMAATLGSDVPFFLSNGLALCEGRGERMTLLDLHWPSSMRWFLLLKPTISISTAAVFRQLTAQDYSDGSHSHAIKEALQSQRPLQTENLDINPHIHNGLERGVLAQYPEVAQARQAMLQAGAPYVRLSGSGPTLFSTFPSLADAAHIEQSLRNQGYEVYLTRAISTNNQDIQYF
jgi:4-diphosphocytidyl-2-C-methyl-D-erythritol kinase